MKFGIIALLSMLSSVAAFAHIQAPVPVNDEVSTRLGVGVQSGVYKPASDYGLRNLEGGVEFVQYIGSGFEFGLGIEGGAVSMPPANLFEKGSMTMYEGSAHGMFRFLGNLTDNFFMGMQLQLDYTHKFDNEDAIASLGDFDLTMGLPFTFGVEDAAWIYVMPSLDLKNFRAVPSKPDSKTNVLTYDTGASLRIGSYVDVGDAWLVLEASPVWADFKKLGDVSVDLSLGVAFDF